MRRQAETREERNERLWRGMSDKERVAFLSSTSGNEGVPIRELVAYVLGKREEKTGLWTAPEVGRIVAGFADRLKRCETFAEVEVSWQDVLTDEIKAAECRAQDRQIAEQRHGGAEDAMSAPSNASA